MQYIFENQAAYYHIHVVFCNSSNWLVNIRVMDV